jgi:HTH-type transcriptional regulator / antitoxin HigA
MIERGCGKMTVNAPKAMKLDPRKYGRLLSKALPTAIRTEAENERALAEMDRLMSKGEDNLTPEEDALLELLADLIEKFEDGAYPIADSPPHQILQNVMEERGLRQADLVPILGSRAAVSRIVNGTRAISKAQAKKLSEYFRMPADLFI